jgi:methionyl aminopeptidase
MIPIKNPLQLAGMRDAGRITGEALLKARDAVKPGVSTYELDKIIHDYIVACKARPSFLNYSGFPASACISVNDEVIHGIPNKRVILKEGDIVKIDVGAYYKGFHGDSARTFPVGKITKDAERLISVTRESFYKGLEKMRIGNRLGDVCSAIGEHISQNGYGIVTQFVGHGIGEHLHESPEVPNFGRPGRGVRLSEGMTLAIEPMVNIGSGNVYVLPDGWTVKTVDKSLSAHYENTVALTDNGVEILTLIEKDYPFNC